MQKKLIWIFILFVVSTSCRTIPKITPFVDASSEIRKGINAGFALLEKSSEIQVLYPSKNLKDFFSLVRLEAV